MGIKKYITHFIKYLQKGGVTYININQIDTPKILEGKNIVITGGTSGIGYEIAKRSTELGAKVLITGRSIERLKEVGKELNCEIIEWNISNLQLCEGKVKQIMNKFNGKIDCFINNAGIFKYRGYNNCTIEEWDSIMSTNLEGVYFATREIINQCFKKNKTGNIIMISSIEGVRNTEGPYAISKASVNHITRSLAKELIEDNIRVNAIAPGVTCSNINHIDETDNVYYENSVGKRVLSPKEIAEVAVFLISDNSKCITGQIISCDNGDTL